MNEGTMTFSHLKDLNILIYNLYDHNLAAHTRISNFFRDVSSLIYFDRASVMFFYKDSDGKYQKLTSITINWDSALLKKYDAHFCTLDDSLPPLDRPEPIVIRSSSFFNAELRQQSEYWQGYMLPNNADYEIMANLQITHVGNYRACVSLTRGKEAGDFTQLDLQVLQMIQPHLSRLAQSYINSLRQGKDVRTLGFYNCMAYCVLNASCQIIQKDSVFDNLNSSMENRLLGKIVSICMELNLNTSPTAHYEHKMEDSPLFLEVTCQSNSFDNHGRQYCCMVYDLSHFIDVTLEQASKKYDLTSREYSVLVKALRGERQEDIAAELYLSVPTVKKYMASIYGKMGVTNQKQIYAKLHLL